MGILQSGVCCVIVYSFVLPLCKRRYVISSARLRIDNFTKTANNGCAASSIS